MKGPFRYTPCRKCGRTTATRAMHDQNVMCKACRRAKNYKPPSEAASCCTDCIWLPSCRVIVFTLRALPCEPDSGIEVRTAKSKAWALPLEAMGVG